MSQTLDAAAFVKVSNPIGWLRSPSFDLTLIVGVAALAFGSGWIFINHPATFPFILFLDLWFLGYHHVIATFTRLVFDGDSFKENKFLILAVPIIIAAIIVPLVLVAGPWILATTYLYWQWFHYTRQSYGIARIYQRKANRDIKKHDHLEETLIYSVAGWGILHRSYQDPSRYLGMPVKCLPVPSWLLQAAAFTALVVLVWWLVAQIVAFRRGQFELPHVLYLASHVLVFSAGYVWIADLNYGWLVVNIWHNAQYVLIVWLYNNNRFKNGVDPQHRFLSVISQRKNMVAYFAVCLLLAAGVYKSIHFALGYFAVAALPLALVVHQTINFHHYVVDGVVWKIRRKPISKTFGIGS